MYLLVGYNTRAYNSRDRFEQTKSDIYGAYHACRQYLSVGNRKVTVYNLCKRSYYANRPMKHKVGVFTSPDQLPF